MDAKAKAKIDSMVLIGMTAYYPYTLEETCLPHNKNFLTCQTCRYFGGFTDNGMALYPHLWTEQK